MLTLHEQINTAWFEDHECIGNSFPVPCKATVRNWEAATVCPCTEKVETGLVHYWAKQSVPATSNSDRIHSKIQGKHEKNTLASDHSHKKLFSTAGGRACKAQFLFPNFWQHLHNLYVSFHGERAEERRWPNQEQESDKAGTKWWLASLASETRKWSCPSQIIYLGAKYHLCNSFVCRSCQTWSPCEPALF